MSVNSKMQAIADAIRAKTGGTDALTLDGMAEAVAGIEAGGGGGFPNGTEWTQSNVTSGNFQPICNANGLWAAGGNTLQYSTDGVTWTRSNLNRIITSVAYGKGIWVAHSRTYQQFYYSTDGMVWSNGTGSIDANPDSIYYANGLFVAGTSTSNVPSYSTDGIKWVQSSTGATFGTIRNADGIWVAGGYNVGLWYSTDGMTWTQSNIAEKSISDIANANGVWIAAKAGEVFYSTDGKTWTSVVLVSAESASTTGGIIRNANGIWVYGGGGSYTQCVYYSTDGMTWTKSNLNKTTLSINYANGVWAACVGGNWGGTGIYYSTDAMTWTKSNVTDTFSRCLLNADGVWVVAVDGNGLWYSKTWEPTE